VTRIIEINGIGAADLPPIRLGPFDRVVEVKWGVLAFQIIYSKSYGLARKRYNSDSFSLESLSGYSASEARVYDKETSAWKKLTSTSHYDFAASPYIHYENHVEFFELVFLGASKPDTAVLEFSGDLLSYENMFDVFDAYSLADADIPYGMRTFSTTVPIAEGRTLAVKVSRVVKPTQRLSGFYTTSVLYIYDYIEQGGSGELLGGNRYTRYGEKTGEEPCYRHSRVVSEEESYPPDEATITAALEPSWQTILQAVEAYNQCLDTHFKVTP